MARAVPAATNTIGGACRDRCSGRAHSMAVPAIPEVPEMPEVPKMPKMPAFPGNPAIPGTG